jgi:hypothetical protein
VSILATPGEKEMPRKSRAVPKEETTNTPILIKTYGEFWNPELVNWNNSYHLLGRRSRKGEDINVYEERGVYVLYKDYLPVYVGKADVSSIGWRLQQHRHSWRKGPRWDRFSWFGVVGLNDKDQLLRRKPGLRVTSDELIATLEALLIVAIDPSMNSRREKFRNAVRLFQADTAKRPEIEDRLESIEDKIEQLLAVREE